MLQYHLLLLRLERQFGIHGVAFEWFRSHLHGRSFRVSHGCFTSTTIHIVCSVPQGSVVGPCLFILYKADLSEVAKHNKPMNIDVFADDMQTRHAAAYYRWYHKLPPSQVSTGQTLVLCLLPVTFVRAVSVCDTYGKQIVSMASNHCCPRTPAACSELPFPIIIGLVVTLLLLC